jgi:RHS repeat-associated protein
VWLHYAVNCEEQSSVHCELSTNLQGFIMTSCVLAFNGERMDPVSETYHLGNGYRAYNPVLMRFTSPDSWSPFGAGGINAYAYCARDPVNRADPSGHMSWQAGLGIGLGILSIFGAIFTGGASIAAAGSISAALAGASTVSLVVGTAALVADVTGIASAATEESNPQASAALGWTSLVFGILSLGAGLAGKLAGLVRSRSMRSVTSVRGVAKATGLPTIYEAVPGRFSESLEINPVSVSVLGSTTGPGANGAADVSEVSFAFEGIKSRRALNILSHGNDGGIVLDPGIMNAQQSYKHFIENVRNFTDYDAYNFLGCCSEQLARDFSSIVRNKQVVGFSGLLFQKNSVILNETLAEGDAFWRVSRGGALAHASMDLQRELSQLPRQALTFKFNGVARTFRNGSLIDAEPM